MIKVFLKSGCLFILFVLFSADTKAQQLATFTQYRELLTIINPGALPIDYFIYDNEPTIFVGATWRDQWRGGEFKPPSTKIIRADYFAADIGLGGILAGAYLIQDSHGIFKTTGIYGKIASVIDLYAGELSLGLTIGMLQNRLESPPVGIQDAFSGAVPDVGFGIFYRQEFQRQGFFYTGFSVPQATGGRIPLKVDDEDLSIKRIQHYYYTFGFLRYMVDNSFIEPSIWVKYVPHAPVDIDINFRAQLADRLSIGAGYSIYSKTLHFNAAILQKWEGILLKFGFGFSNSLASYSSSLGASHEYDINYIF